MPAQSPGDSWAHAYLKYEVQTSLTDFFNFHVTNSPIVLEHVFGSQKTQCSATRIYSYGRADPLTRIVRRVMSALMGLIALKAASREQLAGGCSLRQETSEPKKSNEQE